MNLQEHQGYIHLFPAIPTKWKTGKVSFKNLRSYGGVLVSAKWQNGLQEVALQAKKAGVLRIKNGFEGEYARLQTGSSEQTIKAQDGFFTVLLADGALKAKLMKKGYRS